MDSRKRTVRRCIPLFLVVFSCLAIGPGPLFAKGPVEIGDRHVVTIDSRGRSDVEPQATDTGRRYTLEHPGATYIALHFAEFNLDPRDSLVVSDAHGNQKYTLRGKGKMGAGSFWSRHVKGDTVVLDLVSKGPRPTNSGFRIDEIAAGFADPGEDLEAICGADDKQNAVCYQTSHPVEYDRSRAVARLLIQGTTLCTGWLASASNHLITNQHCIATSNAAMNTDYEFMAEAPSCGSGNCQLCWPGTVFSGASLIQANASLDYALVQITSGNPASIYGHLSIDNRDAVAGEEIYIPQHPFGRGKELGIQSSDPNDAQNVCHVSGFTTACTGSGYQDVGYQCDTEGGSSGSPVLARSSNKVIALHHCASCPNRGVPISLICDEICGLLGTGCQSDADCDDGDPCTDDTCDGSQSCSNTPLSVCCGNGTCEAGESCGTCSSDCVSGGGTGECGNGVCEPSFGEDCLSCSSDCQGKQNGKPDNRFCCGDGDGEGAVPCDDSRCNASGFQCGGTADPFCCGDGTCEGGEDAGNCAIDCPPPICGDGSCDSGEDSCTCSADCGAASSTETSCDDGADNDCDGLTDGDDPDCGCGPKHATCSTGADCCSGICKPNGTCR